jgi:transcriptional regulator with XRE-family HTH domain
MPSSFAARLRHLRTAAGMSAYRLAQLSGLSKQAISHLELGKRQPTLDTASKIARGLGVTVDALLSDNGDAAGSRPAKRKKGGK